MTPPDGHDQPWIDLQRSSRLIAVKNAMTPNLLANLPLDLPEELFTTLLQAPGVQIERIVSHGHQSPDGFWYDQATGEWVIVLKGAARIQFEDHTIELAPGDYLDIPAHMKHRVAWTPPAEPTIWLAVHYPGG